MQDAVAATTAVVALPGRTASAAALPPASQRAPAAHPMTFHEFLSELNPLQYIPVIGSIYRAVTGDVVSESARMVGSLVVGGLTGGPVGVAINVAALAVEKATGIDPEKIEQRLLADIGIGGARAAVSARPAVAAIAAAPDVAAAWSPSQLNAYGVTTTARGALKHGDLEGSDVLNDLELARHATDDRSRACAENGAGGQKQG